MSDRGLSQPAGWKLNRPWNLGSRDNLTFETGSYIFIKTATLNRITEYTDPVLSAENTVATRLEITVNCNDRKDRKDGKRTIFHHTSFSTEYSSTTHANVPLLQTLFCGCKRENCRYIQPWITTCRCLNPCLNRFGSFLGAIFDDTLVSTYMYVSLELILKIPDECLKSQGNLNKKSAPVCPYQTYHNPHLLFSASQAIANIVFRSHLSQITHVDLYVYATCVCPYPNFPAVS